MTYRFNYTTVPHSGTRFLNSYFWKMGFFNTRNATVHPKLTDPGETSAPEYWLSHWSVKQYPSETSRPLQNDRRKMGYPTVSVLQHPLRTAISWISRSSTKETIPQKLQQNHPNNHYLTSCLAAWDSLINFSASNRMVFFNINCSEDKRVDHLLDILKQIGIYEEKYTELTEKFVENRWIEFGAVNTKTKKDYINDGTLPDVFDWNRFDRAVNWYEQEIKKCAY